MDLLIKKIKNMYVQKKALVEALKALEKQQEDAINKELSIIFEELNKELDATPFIICVHPHYDESVVNVYYKEKKQELKIFDFEILTITGDRDAEFEKVITIVENFLSSLDLGKEKDNLIDDKDALLLKDALDWDS